MNVFLIQFFVEVIVGGSPLICFIKVSQYVDNESFQWGSLEKRRPVQFHYKGFSENKNNKDQRINFCFLFLPKEIRKLEELFFVPSFGVKVEKMRLTSNLMMAAVLHFQFEHLFNFTVKHHLKNNKNSTIQVKEVLFCLFLS